MTREIEAGRMLRDEIAEAMTGGVASDRPMTTAELATRVVQYLQRQYGGTEIYIPRPGRAYPVDDILEHLKRTRDIVGTCSKFGLSRATLYRLLDACKGKEDSAP